MSSGNRGAPHPTADAPVYTVYTGGGEPGFHPCRAQYEAPPPKYEDVISGEYLKWNFTSRDQPTSPTTTALTLPPPPESDQPRQENNKGKNRVLLYAVALLLTATFIWRVAIM